MVLLDIFAFGLYFVSDYDKKGLSFRVSSHTTHKKRPAFEKGYSF